MTPLVSVLLLTFNHERYIAQTLDSVLSQQCPFPFEVIVSDDHSTDDTWNIVQAYAAAEPRMITIRSEENLNSNIVTTRAIERSSAEFIAFIDGDDYWTDKKKLLKQVQFLQSDPRCSMCAHDVVVVDCQGILTCPSYAEYNQAPLISDYRSFAFSNYVPGPSPMIRRSALAELPEWFNDVEFGDWALYLAALRHGHAGYIPETMAAYRVHASGYWSGLSQEEQLLRLIRFQDMIIDKGPADWRPEFEKARSRRHDELRVLPSSPPPSIDIALEHMQADTSILVAAHQTATVNLRWGEIDLGTLPLSAGDEGISAREAARIIARSKSGWVALAMLLERTVYPMLELTSESPGFAARLSGRLLAEGLPPPGEECNKALHEKIDWTLLETEAVGEVDESRTIEVCLRQGSKGGTRLTIDLDASRPFPLIVTDGPEISVRFFLGGIFLKEVRFAGTGRGVAIEDLNAARSGWGYELAEAAFLLGVLGYAPDDPKTLNAALLRTIKAVTVRLRKVERRCDWIDGGRVGPVCH